MSIGSISQQNNWFMDVLRILVWHVVSVRCLLKEKNMEHLYSTHRSSLMPTLIRPFLFNWVIFRFHVNFLGCKGPGVKSSPSTGPPRQFCRFDCGAPTRLWTPRVQRSAHVEMFAEIGYEKYNPSYLEDDPMHKYRPFWKWNNPS